MAQDAIRDLGNQAYGRTFGDLMDWEKFKIARDADSTWSRTCEPGDIHTDPSGKDVTCPNKSSTAVARSIFHRCWDPIENALDTVVGDQARASRLFAASDVQGALLAEQQADNDASDGKTAVTEATSPDVFDASKDAAKQYFDDEHDLVTSIWSAAAGDQSYIAYAKQFSNHQNALMSLTQSKLSSAKASLGIDPFAQYRGTTK